MLRIGKFIISFIYIAKEEEKKGGWGHMLKQENLVETLISTSLVPGPYRANKYMSKKNHIG